jgi:uncharacterized protein (TIGR02147 family)
MTKSAAAIVLKKTWLRLRKKDPRTWSLRQVAKDARLSPGFLSKIFSKQKSLTLKNAKKLLQILNVDGVNRELILAAFGPTRINKEKFTLPEIDSFELPPEQSEWLLGRWYRLPLLDLMTTAGFESDALWMANKLGIGIHEVNDSLSKLVESNLAVRDENGRYKKVHAKIRFPTVISKKAIREYHKSQMNRAILELEQKVTPKEFNKRLIVGLSVASNPKKIEEVKTFLHLALYRAAEMLAEDQCNEVYQLNFQLFPQTRES